MVSHTQLCSCVHVSVCVALSSHVCAVCLWLRLSLLAAPKGTQQPGLWGFYRHRDGVTYTVVHLCPCVCLCCIVIPCLCCVSLALSPPASSPQGHAKAWVMGMLPAEGWCHIHSCAAVSVCLSVLHCHPISVLCVFGTLPGYGDATGTMSRVSFCIVFMCFLVLCV